MLVEHCYPCHGETKQQGGLRLDSKAGWQAGGDGGPAVVPGEPDKSPLVESVRYAGDLKMPPKGKLKPDEIAALEQWVRDGAAWPDAAPAAPAVAADLARAA